MAQATPAPLTRAEKYRAECVRWMTDFNPDLFVTFAFNRWISMDEAQRTFEAFHAHLDHKLLGRSYNRRPDERTAYIATIEKPDTNIHVHALFRMTQEQKARFTEIAPGIWKKLVEAGNLDIQPVHHSEGAARYVTKALRPETSDRLLTPPHKEKKLNIAA
ncbi:hypothetical protein F1C10_00265 [Sphingomonas sp. NBWT7]|uniref:hypothetical protein n=1 Tax=Sphingomonas sp. NBWT7 TaxID=2596913 RepID=UPI0016274D2C|nr:hypothetical protein [Sphingomonas sp. NBWT7]QNE30575.1 hypothetical protein F1C10_00265 [Sphingomonas sp. NBWT7]